MHSTTQSLGVLVISLGYCVAPVMAIGAEQRGRGSAPNNDVLGPSRPPNTDALALLQSGAAGQSPEGRIERPEDRGAFTIRAGAWLSRLNGTFTASPSSTGVVVQDDLNLDNYEVAFLGEAAYTWDRWRVQLNGFAFDTASTNIATANETVGSMNIATGDALSSSFSAWSVAGEVAYRIYRPLSDQPLPWSERRQSQANTTEGGRYKGEIGFAPVLGGRGLLLSQSIDDLTSAQSNTTDITAVYLTYGFAVDIHVNMRQHTNLIREMVIEAQGLWGTTFSSGEWLLDVRATASLMFTDCTGLYLGYRLLNFNAVESGATYEGSIQGLVVGATIRF